MKMILYINENSPAVDKVIEEADKLGVEFEYRNVADPAVAEDLIDRGGKLAVPYLVDVENAVEMYGEAEIVDYLQSQSDAAPFDVPDVAEISDELE